MLGGGLVPGGVVLIGGDPGIGKSTLLLQALAALARASGRYMSAAKNPARRSRCARAAGWSRRRSQLQAEIQLEKILGTMADLKPEVAVIDSIQTVYSDALESAPGSVAQVRECAAQLTRVAKQTGITIILVGHVTKEGAIAAARARAHRRHRAVFRRRYAFELSPGARDQEPLRRRQRARRVRDDGAGLKGVSNPSALFLSQHARAGRRQLRDGDDRGLAAAAGRSAGAGRPGAGRDWRGGWRSASNRSGWRCCWRCCIATAGVETATSSTFSSTP